MSNATFTERPFTPFISPHSKISISQGSVLSSHASIAYTAVHVATRKPQKWMSRRVPHPGNVGLDGIGQWTTQEVVFSRRSLPPFILYSARKRERTPKRLGPSQQVFVKRLPLWRATAMLVDGRCNSASTTLYMALDRIVSMTRANASAKSDRTYAIVRMRPLSQVLCSAAVLLAHISRAAKLMN